MSLTADQLAIINTLMYATTPNITESRNHTLKEIVNGLNGSDNKGGLVSPHEWEIVKKAVNSDPVLANVVVKSSYNVENTGDAGCVFANGNEAIICFKGTGKGEWKDNANAGSKMADGTGRNNTISPQQQKAIDFVNSQDLSGYDTVTVTGHSKGGNKAKIVTLLTDKVDRCYSFDGQGFSDDFMKAYKAEIQAKQSKIQNHNADGDYVNILLNDVGQTYYHKSHRMENPARYHSMGVLLDENGKLQAGKQSEVTKALDKGLNSTLRTLPPNKRRDVLRVVGDLMDAGLSGKDFFKNFAKIVLVLKNPANRDELAIIFTIVPIATLSQIPGFGLIIKMLQIMGILPKTAPGDDIKYDDAPQPIEHGDMGGDTSLIFVDFAGVHALTSQLQEAVEHYNNACQNLRSAAMNLIDRWEGEGCNAFARDQQMMLQWCQALGQSAFNIADHMIMTMQKYRDMENKLKNLML